MMEKSVQAHPILNDGGEVDRNGSRLTVFTYRVPTVYLTMSGSEDDSALP